MHKFSMEVFFSNERTVRVDHAKIEFLKDHASSSRRKRSRLCTHTNTDDFLHEMFIVKTRDTYVRPHKNLKESKSFHVIEGAMDVVLFDDRGEVSEVIQMGEYGSGRPFYYRLSEPGYHTLLVRSDVLAFKETINGPFENGDTLYASWAPEEAEHEAVEEFLEHVMEVVKNFDST